MMVPENCPFAPTVTSVNGAVFKPTEVLPGIAPCGGSKLIDGKTCVKAGGVAGVAVNAQHPEGKNWPSTLVLEIGLDGTIQVAVRALDETGPSPSTVAVAWIVSLPLLAPE